MGRGQDLKGWASTEFRDIELGDIRLNKRLAEVANALLERPQDSINRASEDWAAAKAAYRFFDNPKIEHQKILGVHRDRTLERITALPVVLAIQDTSFLNYSELDVEGLGYMGGKSKRERCKGFLIHTTLALDPSGHSEGLPLGILDQQIWTREKIRDKKKLTGKLPKESIKWAQSMLSTGSIHATKVVHVADREADITDFMKQTRETQQDFLIRAKHDRILIGNKTRLWKYMEKQPILFEYEVDVEQDQRKLTTYNKVKKAQTRKMTLIPGRQARIAARLSLVEISDGKEGKMNAYAIYLKEIAPPNKKVCLEWMLLTSVATKNEAEVRERIQWYKMRWHIENFHKMLKSGCRTQECRLETVERLKRYISLNSIIAWRLYWLSRIGRTDQKTNCELVLAKHEWEALYMKIKKKKPPKEPPTLAEAMHWIAKLGGFLGRKNDGYPGVKSMWMGWERLVECADSWLIFKKLNNCG